MNIYKLTPRDITYAGWRYSTFKGKVMIRATTEAQARQLAESAFGIMALVQIGQDPVGTPWSQNSQVGCCIVTNSSHPMEGIAEIVEPTCGPSAL